jgi:hypothetical protein
MAVAVGQTVKTRQQNDAKFKTADEPMDTVVLLIVSFCPV